MTRGSIKVNFSFAPFPFRYQLPFPRPVPMHYRTLYDILGVRANATFEEIKKAYYLRAKACHPDLNPDKPDATEEFQRLVNAFDILSDTETRGHYDKQRVALGQHLPVTNCFHDVHSRIMDTIADDILEEMVVGNDIALSRTTLQTLMLDLTKTTHFIMFREAKQAYVERHFHTCHKICMRLVDLSPQNILYHFYLAEAARHIHRDLHALRHYRICLHLGARRNPPQVLEKIRRHYHLLLRRQGWLGKTIAWLAGAPPQRTASEQERTQQAMDAFFDRALRKKSNHPKQLNPKPARRQIADGRK